VQDGKGHLAFHGHQFDSFVSNNEALSDFFSRLFLIVEKLDTKGKFFSRPINKTVHYFQGNTAKVAEGAERLGRIFNVQVVFCGHTHEAFHVAFDRLDYYNIGSWVNSPSTYITIKGGGVNIQAHE
jgi:UDP-2,3-diacylglucosamine pyrophosphatase LpxH